MVAIVVTALLILLGAYTMQDARMKLICGMR